MILFGSLIWFVLYLKKPTTVLSEKAKLLSIINIYTNVFIYVKSHIQLFELSD